MTRQQLGELIISSENTLYHVAGSILRQDADREDAIHETIVKAFENVHTLRNDSYAKTWMIRILINECYKIIRAQAKILPQEDAELAEGYSASVDSDENTDLLEALKQLETDDRIAVILYYFEGYTAKEIARTLDISENAVRIRLFRARKKLELYLTR